MIDMSIASEAARRSTAEHQRAHDRYIDQQIAAGAIEGPERIDAQGIGWRTLQQRKPRQ